MTRRFLTVCVALLSCCSIASAQIPLGTGFTFQGYLDQLGQPFSGNANLQFRCYDAALGGNLLGAQSLSNVAVANGYFTVALNSTGQLGASAFTGQRRWIEVEVNGATLSPRSEVTAAPYALHAAAPWVTNGLNLSYVRGNVGVGTSSPSDPLSVSATGYGLVHNSTGGATLGTFVDASAGWLGTRSTHPLHLFSSNGGARVTVATSGFVGIGTTTPTSVLHVNGTTQTGAFLMPTNAAAGRVLTSDAAGNGTWQASSGFTLPYSGTASIASDALIRVANTNTNSPFSAGVWGECASNNNGRGVVGFSSATTGVNYGVVGQSDSTVGVGVFGYVPNGNDSALTNPIAVYGLSDGPRGRGVVGVATSLAASIGVEGTGSQNGVRGNSDTGTGVSGSGRTGVSAHGTVLALFAGGDFQATGTKAFRIDHPDDPTNKYLYHYSAESPEVINFYRGTATLDQAGEAIVEMPAYFAHVNTAPSYQLTAIGAPMPMLHVAAEIDEAALLAATVLKTGQTAPVCSFRIAGGAPHGKVSWRVEARRNDRYVQEKGAGVEVDKPAGEKGTYQHPELYGQPAEKGTFHRKRHGEANPGGLPTVSE